MRLEIRTETDPYKLQVHRTLALSLRRLRYLLLITPFLFVAFIQSIAQDAMLQSNERNLAGDLRVAFHRSDYRAALALAQEISAIPTPDTGLQEEVLFIKACSASRLQQREGESFLLEFLEHNRRVGFLVLTGDVAFSVQTNAAAFNTHVQRLYESVGFKSIAQKVYDNRVDLVYWLGE